MTMNSMLSLPPGLHLLCLALLRPRPGQGLHGVLPASRGDQAWQQTPPALLRAGGGEPGQVQVQRGGGDDSEDGGIHSGPPAVLLLARPPHSPH